MACTLNLVMLHLCSLLSNVFTCVYILTLTKAQKEKLQTLNNFECVLNFGK